MPVFGARSREVFATLHPDLQKVFEAAIKDTDFALLSGHRGKEEQDELVRIGASRLVFPLSHHNTNPSLAADVAPWPIDWNDIGRFTELATHVLAHASRFGVPLVWGGHWTRFPDYGHFEVAV